MTYDVDYFIEKFEAIPEKYWATGTFRNITIGPGALCAQGHCMGHHGIDLLSAMEEVGQPRKVIRSLIPEWKALWDLFDANIPGPHNGCCVGAVNNGVHAQYTQDTPRKRILAALADIKKKLEHEDKLAHDKHHIPKLLRKSEPMVIDKGQLTLN